MNYASKDVGALRRASAEGNVPAELAELAAGVAILLTNSESAASSEPNSCWFAACAWKRLVSVDN